MIEQAQLCDQEEVYQLICELEQETLDQQHFINVYQEGINNSDIEYWIYRYENKIIGFISLYIHRYLHHHHDTGEIVELVVLPEYRGLRVGDRLIRHIEKRALQRNLEELELSTSTYRKKAHRFYEAHGFILDHYNYTKKLT